MTRKTKLSDSPWFPHDVDTTADPKIVALLSLHGAVGYAVFWRAVETLHQETGHVFELEGYVPAAIAGQLKVDESAVVAVLKDCCGRLKLFTLSASGEVMSNRVKRNTEAKQESIELKKEAANKRWSGGKNATSTRNAGAMQVHSRSTADAKQKQNNRNADAVQNDAHNSTVHNILSEGERMLGNVPVSEHGAQSAPERLLGAFVAAWPQKVSEDEKKLVAARFESISENDRVDMLTSLSVELEDWSEDMTVERFLILYDPNARR